MIEIDLPLGHAAINRRFKFRYVLSDEYAAFKRDLSEFVRGLRLEPLKGAVYLEIYEGWDSVLKSGPAKGLAKGDEDAPIKCIQDALKIGGAFGDDAQVTQLYVEKDVRPTTLIRFGPAGPSKRPVT